MNDTWLTTIHGAPVATPATKKRVKPNLKRTALAPINYNSTPPNEDITRLKQTKLFCYFKSNGFTENKKPSSYVSSIEYPLHVGDSDCQKNTSLHHDKENHLTAPRELQKELKANLTSHDTKISNATVKPFVTNHLKCDKNDWSTRSNKCYDVENISCDTRKRTRKYNGINDDDLNRPSRFVTKQEFSSQTSCNTYIDTKSVIKVISTEISATDSNKLVESSPSIVQNDVNTLNKSGFPSNEAEMVWLIDESKDPLLTKRSKRSLAYHSDTSYHNNVESCTKTNANCSGSQSDKEGSVVDPLCLTEQFSENRSSDDLFSLDDNGTFSIIRCPSPLVFTEPYTDFTEEDVEVRL